MTFSRAIRVNVTVGVAETTETTLQTSAAYNGVTFTFDRAMPVGYFITGEPFVVSEQAFAITAISPAAVDIQGDGYIGNGTMKNPYVGSNQSQGFDAYLGEYLPNSSYPTPYSAGVNVDPAVAGSLAVAVGERASIVKSVRDAGKVSTTNQYATVGKYVVLSVLDQAPPVNAYRPGMAGTAKKIYTRDMVDFTPRGLPLPASFPSVAEIISSIPDNMAPFIANSEQRRFLRLDTLIGTTNDGYSGEIVDAYARWIYAVNSSSATIAQRQAIIDRIITFAGDIEAILDIGFGLGGTAGQGGAIWHIGMAAAALLKDASLHAKFIDATMQPNVTSLWVGPSKIGAVAPSRNGNTGQTYFDEHLNIPWIEPEMQSSAHDARYSEIGAFINSWEVLSVLAFDQGPPGFANGAEMILNGGANDATNPYAAKLAFANMFRSWTGPFYSAATAYQPNTDFRNAWDQMVAEGDFVPYSGPPEQPPQGSNNTLNDTYFTAGDGTIVLDTKGVAHATETVTRTDMRFSLDGVQWIEDSDITLSANRYIRSGLLKGAAHYAGWRRWSASGPSLWSANHPQFSPINGGDERGFLATTGTAAIAAPINTVAPSIHQRLHPSWDYKVWEPASGTLGLNDIELAAGVGYWSGFPAPSFAFQWKRNGAAIAGATGQVYVRTAADAGAVLTCDVTATNSQGAVTVTTAGLTCPGISTLASDTLIDTDFKGAFAVDYEAELLGLSGGSYTIIHEPGAWPDALEGLNAGALHFNKTAGWPSGVMPLSRPAVASTTYDITAQLAVDGDSASSRGDFYLTVLDGTDAVLFSAVILGSDVVNAPGRSLLADFTGSFTTGSNTTLRVRVNWPNGAGGSGGGDPYLTQLRIAEAA